MAVGSDGRRLLLISTEVEVVGEEEASGRMSLGWMSSTMVCRSLGSSSWRGSVSSL